jgi:hypothetical protein
MSRVLAIHSDTAPAFWDQGPVLLIMPRRRLRKRSL